MGCSASLLIVITASQYWYNQDPVDFDIKHTVWRDEEKQTDVNIAVHMLCDVVDEKCEQCIVFSNDSDLAPVLKEIRERSSVTIGTVAPIRERRQPSIELSKHSHWNRRSIRDEELESSQLPNTVKTRKRSVQKPVHW